MMRFGRFKNREHVASLTHTSHLSQSPFQRFLIFISSFATLLPNIIIILFQQTATQQQAIANRHVHLIAV